MHNCITLALMLVVPSCGQIRRGDAKICYSNFHNYGCVPVDGGVVWSFAMSNINGSTCTAGNNTVPNDASFTGSTVIAANCGGGTAPSLTATGLSMPSGGNMIINANPDFPNGWTITTVAKPTAVNAAAICGLDNVNFNTNDTRQYQGGRVDLSASGDSGFLYELSGGTVHAFSTAGSTLSAGAWFTATHTYKSATAGSAQIWLNNAKVTGSWTIGNGTASLPAVQAETEIAATHAGSVNCIGIVGLVVAHDHNANWSLYGLMYQAAYKTMQFRGVAIP